MNKNKLAFRLSKVLLSIVIIGLIVALSVNIIKTVRTPYTSSAYFAYNNISKMISTLYSDARTLVLRDKYASVNVQNTDDNMRKLTYLGHSAFLLKKMEMVY